MPLTDNDISLLGDPFFEEKGKIITSRVLSIEPEVQIEYSIFLRKGGNGIYYSQGLGIVSTTDGTGMSTWASHGIQNTTNKKNRLRGSAFYTTTSTGKLAFLNNMMTIFKSETDEAGNISNKEWEWK